MLLNIGAQTVERSIDGSIPKLKLVMKWKKTLWLFGDWLLKRCSDIKCVQNKSTSDCIICMHQNERSQSSNTQKRIIYEIIVLFGGGGLGKNSIPFVLMTPTFHIVPLWMKDCNHHTYISFKSGPECAQHFPHTQSASHLKKITKAIYWHNANK